MRFEILLAPEAVENLGNLKANVRSEVREAIEKHLRHESEKESRSRIKRLSGLSQPQYRLRVGEIRVFYDVLRPQVQVLAIVQGGGNEMARRSGKTRMRRVALSEVKDDLSKYLRLAEDERIVITRHGKPAGVLVGFGSEEDWFDYRLETDPRFLERIAKARANLKAGRGVRLEDLAE